MKRILLLLAFILPLAAMAQTNELFEKRTYEKDGGELLYRIMMPENFSKAEKYPLVLFLHGAGERGNDNESQLVHGASLFTSAENRADFPAIVVFPQCPKDSYWSNAKKDRSKHPIGLKFPKNAEPTEAMSLVMSLLDEMKANPSVDTSRIYVVGLSMGGMGTFEILSRRPNTFAAAIPICGGGNAKLVERYAHVPTWVFAGAKDDVVNPLNSVHMVEAYLENGAHPQFTIFENANHNSWDPAFAEPEFLPWLFSKQKNN